MEKVFISIDGSEYTITKRTVIIKDISDNSKTNMSLEKFMQMHGQSRRHCVVVTAIKFKRWHHSIGANNV